MLDDRLSCVLVDEIGCLLHELEYVHELSNLCLLPCYDFAGP